MRRFIVRLSALAIVGLLALPILSAAAVVPIPVATDVHDNGVFLQVHTQRVFDENGVAYAREVTGCTVNVWTTPDGVGETMTSNLGSATVNPVYFNGSLVYGRAIFSGVLPGETLTTTNTDVAVSATCPSGLY